MNPVNFKSIYYPNFIILVIRGFINRFSIHDVFWQVVTDQSGVSLPKVQNEDQMSLTENQTNKFRKSSVFNCRRSNFSFPEMRLRVIGQLPVCFNLCLI